MNHWPYIAAAYALTIGGMGALALFSWWKMRRAEEAIEAMASARSPRAKLRGAVTASEFRPSTSLGTSEDL